MSYVYKVRIKIHGICQVKSKWLKLQYKDEWGDEDSLYLPHGAWKKMDKPGLGDELLMEVTRQ